MMKIGASMLVAYLRHAYDTALGGARSENVDDGIADNSSHDTFANETKARRAVMAAAAKVCTGMSAGQIISVADGRASVVGWHPLGMTYVAADVKYDPASHDGGPIKLVLTEGRAW